MFFFSAEGIMRSFMVSIKIGGKDGDKGWLETAAIYEFCQLFGQGNLVLVMENSGKSQEILKTESL